MAKYQKILQLYRTTNIWDTKNIAKAEVERHAKLLHAELGAQLRDGEPIIAKYYDPAEGYTFVYAINGTGSGTDPYGNTSESAKHVWADGFDSFDISEWDATHLKPKNKENVDYDSAAYVRVKDGGTYTYYLLKVSQPGTIPNRDESAVFGVVLSVDNERDLTIEWFDSAAEAKGAIGELNYNDRDLTNGFVALVNQKDGKIESIHGTISGENAVSVRQDAYTYTKLPNDSTIPSDYIWNGDNQGQSLPQSITEDSPTYYNVTGSGDNSGFYELRKNIDILLNIDSTEGTGDPNVLSQSDAGLKVNLNLRQLTQTEINALPNGLNVKEAYKLVGNAGSTEKQIGETIKIYKDSSLYKVYLGGTGDSLTDVYAWREIEEGQGIVYTVDGLVDDRTHDIVHDGSMTYTKIPNKDEYEESGINVSEYDSTNKTITVNERKYEYIGSATPWIKPNVGGSEALCFVYYLANDDYELVAIDLEDFLQESEFGDGLKVNNHVVSVNLDSDGGIDFEDDESNVNKSLKIKIDDTTSNTYYREIRTGETVESTNRYNYVGIDDPDADDYGYKQDNDGTYVKDQYLHTTSNGLAVDQDVLENKITDNVSKVLYVNGEKFVKDDNGDIKAIVTGNDIKIAGAGSTIPNVDKTEIYGDTHEWSYIPNPGSSTPDYIITGVNNIMTLEYRKDGDYKNYPQQRSDEYIYEYIEANGLIFKWNTEHEAYELFFIDKDTNLNDAISIVEYLVYNLDMGMFTI